MCVVYVAVVIIVALATSCAAAMSCLGAESVKAAADRVRVPRKVMIPFGMLLAAGAVGLVAGLVIPVVGEAAAVGLVLYFICAVGAHLRVHDRNIGAAVSFLVLAVGALIAELGLASRGC